MYMFLYNVRIALKEDFALSSDTAFQVQRASASSQSIAKDEIAHQLFNIWANKNCIRLSPRNICVVKMERTNNGLVKERLKPPWLKI